MARNEPRTKTEYKSWPLDLQVKWRPFGGGSFTSDPHLWTIRAINTVTYGPNFNDWKLRLQLGYSATTTLVGSRAFMQHQQPLDFQVLGKKGTVAEGFARVGFGRSPNFTMPGAPAMTIDSVAERLASSRFLKSYIDATRTWHGGATIAEFSESVRFLASPIKSLYRHTFDFVGRVGRLRKVYRRDPVKYGKLLGSLWLTYAFGLAPMVSDVNDAYAAVKKLADDLGSVDTLRIIGSGNNTIVELDTPVLGIPYTNYAIQTRLITLENQVRYLGMARCKPPGPAPIADNFGIGFTDILPAVWEGIPWSWLVDYFVNVNEMLDSVKLAFANIQWVNRTIRNSRVHRYGSARLNFSPSDSQVLTGYAVGGQGFTRRTGVNRTASAVPYPSWQFRIPGLPSQYANVNALLLSIERSKPPKPLGPVRRR